MRTTHDLQNEHLVTPYVDLSPDHWSQSKEWAAYQAAKWAATTTQNIDPLRPREDVTETEAMRSAWKDCEAAYPPDEPEPTSVMDARTVELQAATIELGRAVERLRKLAHGDRIVGLVARMVAE